MNCMLTLGTCTETGPPALHLTPMEFATLKEVLDFATTNDDVTTFTSMLANFIIKANEGDLETLHFFKDNVQNRMISREEARNAVYILQRKGLACAESLLEALL